VSLKIKPESLGFLKGIPGFENWDVEEYRSGGHTTVTIKGQEPSDKFSEIETAFFAWYNPNGYGSQIRKAVARDGQPLVILERWLSCD
jgi:hypothetical protein